MKCPTMKQAMPKAADASMNWFFDHFRPACARRTDSGGRPFFLCRASNSLSVSATASRRER